MEQVKYTQEHGLRDTRSGSDAATIQPLGIAKKEYLYLCPGLSVLLKSKDKAMNSYQGQQVFEVQHHELPGIRKTYFCQSRIDIEIIDLSGHESGAGENTSQMEAFYRLEKAAEQDDKKTGYAPWIRRD